MDHSKKAGAKSYLCSSGILNTEAKTGTKTEENNMKNRRTTMICFAKTAENLFYCLSFGASLCFILGIGGFLCEHVKPLRKFVDFIIEKTMFSIEDNEEDKN